MDEYTPRAQPAGGAQSVMVGRDRVTFLLGAAETSGRYSLTKVSVAPSPPARTPMHCHRDADELCYVLAGELTVQLEDETMRLVADEYLLIPRGRWHSIANPRPTPTRILMVLTPPGFERYWAEVAALPRGTGGEADPGEMAFVQQKHYMETREATHRSLADRP